MDAAWGALRCSASLFSTAGSIWLLRVCSPRSRFLSSRQLWHLGLADLGHSVVQLAGEVPVVIQAGPPTRRCAEAMRALVHLCLFAICLVETQIAAGVAAAGLRSLRPMRCLALVLPGTWPLAIMCLAVDLCIPGCGILQTTVVMPSGEVTGSSLVVGIAMAVCFLASMVLYIAAIVSVVRTPSPSVVVRRASMRALLYPWNFAVTVLPTWFVYVSVIRTSDYPESCCSTFVSFSAVCLFSNGWVNAATYLLQNRLEWRRRGDGIGRVDSLSLGVGFGAVSVSTVSCRSQSWSTAGLTAQGSALREAWPVSHGGRPSDAGALGEDGQSSRPSSDGG
mmetsp:Transcript_45849/g.146393  ORF Transcript_45849/g.146393 Transcript_45849/m.146393 type:complete len:336 (+) Transcript_45849:71-1078(+)